MIHKTKYVCLVVLVMFLAIYTLSSKANAAGSSKDETHDLYIYYQYDNTPLSGANVSIYKIGNLDSSNFSKLYQANDLFLANENGIEEKFSQSEWKKLCAKYEELIIKDKISDYKTIHVSNGGVAKFTNIQPGVYFVNKTKFEIDKKNYVYESFIVIVPHNYENTASADVIKAYPKGALVKTHTDGPEVNNKAQSLVSKYKTKTGDYNNIYLFAIAFIISGLVMLTMIFKKGRKHENRKR